jgi:hypothetical protein
LLNSAGLAAVGRGCQADQVTLPDVLDGDLHLADLDALGAPSDGVLVVVILGVHLDGALDAVGGEGGPAAAGLVRHQGTAGAHR